MLSLPESKSGYGLVSGGLLEAIHALAVLPSGAVTPVVFEPVFGRFPGGQAAVFGEARAFAVATFEPARPVGHAPVLGPDVRASGQRQDLRAAGRTPVDPFGDAAHLRVTTLAGMAAQGHGGCGYLQ